MGRRFGRVWQWVAHASTAAWVWQLAVSGTSLLVGVLAFVQGNLWLAVLAAVLAWCLGEVALAARESRSGALRIVVDGVWGCYGRASGVGAHPYMELGASLHVTNRAGHTVRLLRTHLKRGRIEGSINPVRKDSMRALLVFAGVQTEIIDPDDTQTIDCEYGISLGTKPVVHPWEHKNRIVLVDQDGREHRTRRLTWTV